MKCFKRGWYRWLRVRQTPMGESISSQKIAELIMEQRPWDRFSGQERQTDRNTYGEDCKKAERSTFAGCLESYLDPANKFQPWFPVRCQACDTHNEHFNK